MNLSELLIIPVPGIALLYARQQRLTFYRMQKAGISDYGIGKDRGAKGTVGEDFGMIETQNRKEIKNGVVEALQGEVFETTPKGILCQNR